MSTPDPGVGRHSLAVWIATAGGIGRLRPGPGTWASAVVAIACGFLAARCPGVPLQIGFAVAAVVTAVIGVPAATGAGKRFGCADPSSVVIDEVAGQLAAFALLPAAALAASPVALSIASFLMFRVFDIAKPWPVCALEELPAGFGVMADDCLAGVLAGVVVAASMC